MCLVNNESVLDKEFVYTCFLPPLPKRKHGCHKYLEEFRLPHPLLLEVFDEILLG